MESITLRYEGNEFRLSVEERIKINAAVEAAKESLGTCPGIGSPDGRSLWNTEVTLRAFRALGGRNPTYKGSKMEPHHSALFERIEALRFGEAV